MIINHNISALNAFRQLSTLNVTASKSLQKLSSGLRINSAADDSACLAISQKMRGQIRALHQASRNAQDGISLIQTAEGALNETNSMLQRLRELAVQSASDPNTNADRAQIQLEVNQLTSEIDGISHTQFNTKNLLDGSLTSKPIVLQTGANAGQSTVVSINDMSAAALGISGSTGEVTTTASGTVNPTNPTANVASVTFGSDLGDKILNGANLTFTYNAGNITISNGTPADNQIVAANANATSFSVNSGNYKGLSVNLASGKKVSDLTSGSDGVSIALSTALTSGKVAGITPNLNTVSFGGSLGSKITNGANLSFTYNGNNTVTISDGNSADDQTIAVNGTAQSFAVGSGNYKGLSVSLASGRHVSDLRSGDDGVSIALSAAATGSVSNKTPNVGSVSFGGSLGSKITNGANLSFTYNGNNTVTISNGNSTDNQTIAANAAAQSFAVSSGNYKGLSVTLASGKAVGDLTSGDDGVSIALSYTATGSVIPITPRIDTVSLGGSLGSKITDGASFYFTYNGDNTLTISDFEDDQTIAVNGTAQSFTVSSGYYKGLSVTLASGRHVSDLTSVFDSVIIDLAYSATGTVAGGTSAITTLVKTDGANITSTVTGSPTFKTDGEDITLTYTAGNPGSTLKTANLVGLKATTIAPISESSSIKIDIYENGELMDTVDGYEMAHGNDGGHYAITDGYKMSRLLMFEGVDTWYDNPPGTQWGIHTLDKGSGMSVSVNITGGTAAERAAVGSLMGMTSDSVTVYGTDYVAATNSTVTIADGSGHSAIVNVNDTDTTLAGTGYFSGLSVNLVSGKKVTALNGGAASTISFDNNTTPAIPPIVDTVSFDNDVGSKISAGANLTFTYNSGSSSVTISNGNPADDESVLVNNFDNSFQVYDGNYKGMTVNLASGKAVSDLTSGNDGVNITSSISLSTGTVYQEPTWLGSVSFAGDIGSKITNGETLSFTYGIDGYLTISNGNIADDQKIAAPPWCNTFTVDSGNYKGLTINLASGKQIGDLLSCDNKATVAVSAPSVTGSVNSETVGLDSVSFGGDLGTKVTDGSTLSFTYNGNNTLTIRDGNAADDQTIAVNPSDTSFTVSSGNFKGLTVNIAMGKTASDLMSGNDRATVALSTSSVTGSVTSETAGLASVSFGSGLGTKVTNGATLSFTYNGGNTLTISNGNSADDQTIAVAASATSFTVNAGNFKGTTVNIAPGKTASDLTSGNDAVTISQSAPTVTGSVTSNTNTAGLSSVSFGSDLGSMITNGANLKFTYSSNAVTISNGTSADDQIIAVNAADTSFMVSSGNYKGMTINLASGKTVSDLTSGTDSITISVSSSGGGTAGIDLTSQPAASAAIPVIDGAISLVSSERANLGAMQNRLEHAMNNLSATSQNLTDSESHIADADMAQEMMEYTKNNILVQAATAMLAQANQTPQAVLQLLKSA